MKIKEIPEDFVVDELIDLKLEEGDQTYFWLKKRSWTTDSAIREIARRLYTSQRRFKFAGTKDKRAVTRQAISAFKIPSERLSGLKIQDMEIEVIGKGKDPISIGTLKGNKFYIVIRDLEERDIQNMKDNMGKMALEGFPNYFGEQRFGMGSTHLIGKLILKGELEEAAKTIVTFTGETEADDKKRFREFAKSNWGNWKSIAENLPMGLRIERDIIFYLIENPTDFGGALRQIPKHTRKLYVHAFQSYLWNQALKETHQNGSLPIPGFETSLGEDNFSTSIKSLLEKEEIKLEDFKISRMPELSLEGDLREAFIRPEGLSLGEPENDDLNTGKKKIFVKFDLPKGCYATVFVDCLCGLNS